MSLLSSDAQPTRLRAAAVLSRAGRIALAGLLIPAAIPVVAGLWGFPVPASVRIVLDWLPVAGFALSGTWAASALNGSRRCRARMTAGFGLAGLAVTPAYASLTGLSGREPVSVAVFVVAGAFGLGFAAAAVSAVCAGRRPGRARHAAVRGLFAGIAGGLVALIPFLCAAGRLELRVPLGRELAAVVSTFGGLLLPYWLVGAALDAADADVT